MNRSTVHHWLRSEAVMNVVPAVGLLVLTAALTVPAAAQTRDTTRLPELTSTATGVPVAPSAISASVTVISGEELRERGIRFVLDALRDAPGIQVVQQGSFGGLTSLFLRGGNSDYVKVLLDGVPLNAPGGGFDYANLTTDNIDRIEIVRGPASVLYGADAVTGVIQIFTRKGSGPAHAEAQGQGGTFGSSVFGASASGGSGASAWSVEGSRTGSSGFYPINNAYRNTVLSGRLSAAPDAQTDVALTVRYTDNQFNFPTTGGTALDANQFSFQTATALGLTVTRRFRPSVEGRLALTSNDVESGFDNAPDSPADTIGFGFASKTLSNASRRGLDARVNLTPVAALVLTAGGGIEFERERQSGQTTSNFGTGISTEPSAFGASRHTASAYLNGLVTAASGLTLNGGVRVDDNNAFATFVTYRAGASWVVAGGTRVRGSVGTAFKAPTFSQIFADSPFERGNAALSPEHTRTYEIGLEQSVAHGVVVLSATAFSQRFTDLIQYLSVTSPDSATYYNVARARARGIEVGAHAQPFRTLVLDANYTYLDTRVLDGGPSGGPGTAFEAGRPLLRRPAHTARIGGRWRPVPPVVLGANVNVIGRRDDLDFSAFPATRVTLARYALVETSVEAGLLAATAHRPGVTATFRVENLFDAQYQSVLGFPGRGRTIFAGGRLRW